MTQQLNVCLAPISASYFNLHLEVCNLVSSKQKNDTIIWLRLVDQGGEKY